ncbi:hypothetical protein KZ483_07660 [Paenibacillus sp. sptzw28]|uniref:hypothetical protein n=1 Tax=Paenibacillus sp. sptzw28 TaxID=715179 RepID=UPI001C6F3127|nr:hypothetical protein [Paenibacillus sp. sptzw28]QYR22805.1 hypothetical protein KZ483_07660 [Paenibacillus sp. sptzw28]
MTTLFRIKTILAKVLLVGGCLMALSANAAFAVSGSISETAIQNQQTAVEDALLQKQQEIDSYVFGEGQEELTKQGFQVTTTGAQQGFVEVGIAPYNEAYADFLYEKFGRDLVKVVKGEQAVLLGTPAAAAAETGAAAATVTDGDDAVSSSGWSGMYTVLIAACAVVVGVLLAVRRKLPLTRK